MVEIELLLLNRKEYLINLKREKEKALGTAPKGTVRLITSGVHTQFYHRMEPSMRVGVYIPKKDLALAQSLAQKDYDQKVLKSIEQEIKAIDMYLAKLPHVVAEDVYESLHVERQKLIRPIRKTDKQFVQEWMEFVFQGKGVDDAGPLLVTEKGEKVRSKSEMIIADTLHRAGIPYRYECPLHLSGYGEVYPDFTALNIGKRKEVYWEHLGMMDDPMYMEKALRKIDTYERNGIVQGKNLIVTWETKKLPFNLSTVKRKIEEYLK
ncbi:MAG: hypothetical protein IJY10_03730 [Lachnospiraceae bacterium]|nr:hypothetical protein [Lachnospiraceae bacterium]